MDAIKEFINLFADPRIFFGLGVAGLAFIVWQRELFAKNAVGYGLMAFLTVFFAIGLFDENFVLIIAKADNVPIVGLIFLVVFFTWYSMREAVRNDRRMAAGDDPIEKKESDRVWVWARPGLQRANCADSVHGDHRRLVDPAGSPDRAARQSCEYAEPIKGTVVFPWDFRRCWSTSIRGWLGSSSPR